MKLVFLNSNGVYSHKIVTDGIREAFQQLNLDFIEVNINNQDDGTIDKYNPDFIFINTPISPHFRVWKKYRNRKTIAYDVESLYEPGNVRDALPYCDYLATVDKRGCQYFREFAEGKGLKCKIYHMPLGFSPSAYKFQDVTEEYKSDVILAGAIFDRRRKTIDDLYSLRNTISFRVITPKDWLGRIIKRDAIKNLHTSHVSVEELGKYYAGSKIILCVNRDYDPANDTKIQSTTPGRVFQETACRRLVMIDRSRPEVFDYFIDGKEIVSFDENNPKDLHDKILYYLGHEKEREEIAHNGYVRTMKENMWKHRIEKLLEFVKLNNQ
jgi:spore maturation protein CgeB